MTVAAITAQLPQQQPTRAAVLALAGRLVGLPWRKGAQGPDAFNCWGLVRYWHLQLYGLDLGAIAVAVDAADTEGRQLLGQALPVDADQMLAIRQAIRSGGWAEVPAGQRAHAGDVLLLRNPHTGGRHIGVLLVVSGALGVLHCEGSNDKPDPGVVWQSLADVLATYADPTCYRRPAAAEALAC